MDYGLWVMNTNTNTNMSHKYVILFGIKHVLTMFVLKDVLLLAGVLFAIDALYLRSIANYFNTQVSLVQGSTMEIDKLAAGLCYVALVVGLYWFVIRDANLRQIQNWNSPVLRKTMLQSAILGWVIYAVYELTSKSILKKWMWNTVILDGVWGGVLFALSTFVYWFIQRKFGL